MHLDDNDAIEYNKSLQHITRLKTLSPRLRDSIDLKLKPNQETSTFH